eukprot:883889-Pyramimonas_sp.AAC.1
MFSRIKGLLDTHTRRPRSVFGESNSLRNPKKRARIFSELAGELSSPVTRRLNKVCAVSSAPSGAESTGSRGELTGSRGELTGSR